MRNITFTFLADGSSDKTLMSVIKWLMTDLYPQIPIQLEYANFSFLSKPPRKLSDRIGFAITNYPSDILLVHRDVEKNDDATMLAREEEIMRETPIKYRPCTVAITPIKMMETWLLINADAIKKAAGNRHSKTNIALPAVKRLQAETNPKELLHELLKTASGLTGRRLDKFNVHAAIHCLADFIEDFSILRDLSSFQQFEANLVKAVNHVNKAV